MYKINPEKVFWRKIEGKTFVCDSETGFSYELEGAGVLIWDWLVAGKSSEEIALELAREHEVILQTAREDVEALLLQLKEAGLVDLDGKI